jgi:hypothetical protein
VYSIQHYVIKFVSDLWQVSGFLRVLRFPPPIKLTAWGINIYIINIWQIENNKASLPCKQYRLRVCFKLKDGKTNCITVRLGKINCQGIGTWITIMQSVPITTNIGEFESSSSEMYLIQHYVIKFVSNMRQVCGFLWVLRFPPSIKSTAMI